MRSTKPRGPRGVDLGVAVLMGLGHGCAPVSSAPHPTPSTGPSAAPPASVAEVPEPLTPAASASSGWAPLEQPTPGRVVRVVASDERACAMFEGGALQCWGGLNMHGEAGAGHTKKATKPAWVKGLSGVQQLALSSRSTCAVVERGQVACWGQNWFMPPPAQRNILAPTLIAGLTDVVEVAIGGDQGCALQKGGQVLCWGRAREAEAEGASDKPQNLFLPPTAVPGLKEVVGLVVSSREALAWTRAGELFRWPSEDHLLPATPERVEGLTEVARVAADGEHACALLRSGEVRCFTRDTLPALKEGKQHDYGPAAQAMARAILGKKYQSAAVKRAMGNMIFQDGRGLRDVQEMVVFHHDASALTRSGEVFSWGSGERGTTGHPHRIKGFWPPTRIEGLSDVTAVAGGFQHRCALRRDGSVSCFGDSHAIGREGPEPTLKAVQITGLPRVKSLAASDHCTFALGEDHSLWVWGGNWIYACGIDTKGGVSAPQRLSLEDGTP